MILPLKLRPTGLGSGIDKDRPDYSVYSVEWESVASTRPAAVADCKRSDDASRSRGDPRRGQGAVSEELGRLEGVGEAGRGSLTSLSPLAALPNWRRFFVNLLRGVAPFRRGRYRCWSSICGRRGGLGNYFFAAVLGDASAQSQEAKRCGALRLKS